VVDASDRLPAADAVIDTVGGLLDRSTESASPGGVVVSAVQPPDRAKATSRDVRAEFFIVQVSTATLRELPSQIDAGQISTNVGEVLDFTRAREAHEMLAGRPHRGRKIVLRIEPN
jgi:NADPH:quinone reductase-like Zn-dependent oxidoreductase